MGILITGLLIFPSSDNWQLSIPEIGSATSPHAIDLDQDGILDIVLGGGGKEFASTEYGVVAIDGKDGSILWQGLPKTKLWAQPSSKILPRMEYLMCSSEGAQWYSML